MPVSEEPFEKKPEDATLEGLAIMKMQLKVNKHLNINQQKDSLWVFEAFCFKEFSFFIVDFPFHVRWKETDEEIWSKAISGLSEIGPQPSSRTPCANTLRAPIYNQHFFTLWSYYCFKYDKSRGPPIRLIHCQYIILWSKNSYQKEFIWEIAFKNDYFPDHHHHHLHDNVDNMKGGEEEWLW